MPADLKRQMGCGCYKESMLDADVYNYFIKFYEQDASYTPSWRRLACRPNDGNRKLELELELKVQVDCLHAGPIAL